MTHRSRILASPWSPVIFLTTGILLVFLPLVAYTSLVSENLFLSARNADSLEKLAYGSLLSMLAGFGIIAYAASRLLSDKTLSATRSSSAMAVISSIMTDRRYLIVAIASGATYALFYAVVSSIIVYQPGVFSSKDYGVAIPSANVILCCGPVGQVPQFVVYLSEHLGLLLVPLNMILMFVVSWLVGFNAAIVWYAYDNRSLQIKGGWLTALGAGAGLFTACPTCAGFFLSSLLGLSGVFSVAAGLSWLQGSLVASGIVLLTAGPILATKKIAESRACTLPRRNVNTPV